MPKGEPQKRYTPEFKKMAIETMQQEKLLRWQLNNRQRNNIQFNAVLLAPCGATAKHGKYYFGNP